jgi:ATP-dependent DNA helicase RecQ
MSAAGAELDQALREVFGFDAFRAHQREVIESVLSGRPTVAVMPTGGGKSLCYRCRRCCCRG